MLEFWIHKLPHHLFYRVAHFLFFFSSPQSFISQETNWIAPVLCGCVLLWTKSLNFQFDFPFNPLLVPFFFSCDFPQTEGTALFDSFYYGGEEGKYVKKKIVVSWEGAKWREPDSTIAHALVLWSPRSISLSSAGWEGSFFLTFLWALCSPIGNHSKYVGLSFLIFYFYLSILF